MKTLIIVIMMLFVAGCSEPTSTVGPEYQLVDNFKRAIPDSLIDPFEDVPTILQYDFRWIGDSVHTSNIARVKLRKAKIVGWTITRDHDYLTLNNFTDGMPLQDSAIISIDPIIEKFYGELGSDVHYFSFNLNNRHVPFIVYAEVQSWRIEKRLLPNHPIWGYPFKNDDYKLSVWVYGFMSEPHNNIYAEGR